MKFFLRCSEDQNERLCVLKRRKTCYRATRRGRGKIVDTENKDREGEID